ncbi:hydrogenase nickel incorporation protein HypB [Vibrio penaeicida]|uniref:hydrogenase nickel incorporation protein HypB n=1 Tax=Vibrio penaeicida TaxID=104609 RepID=UPI002735F562|nr:hydrogenase nickel incorporation protein HypB [Vibrio penaeicida]MDP2574236.1 hydrogenase nickel incorporation protein HypB [Vibrio penaeicida]
MCTVCGCSDGEVSIEKSTDDDIQHQSTHSHEHHHSHDDQTHEGDIHFGHGPAGAHVPELSQSRMVQIEQDILGKNNRYASLNRRLFTQKSQFVLNLVSSPGSGKTSLLTATLESIASLIPTAVIEGDQQTTNDAERIRSTGVKAVQVNTGKGCHLDAHMVGHALETLKLPDYGVLFIENVGNLVCPASFDLGEAHKVAILSITEGEDKPLKYPDMFAASDLILINKIDLLPHLNFDLDECIQCINRVNPSADIIQVSATSGVGMDRWLNWIHQRRNTLLMERKDVLSKQLEELECQLGTVPKIQ